MSNVTNLNSSTSPPLQTWVEKLLHYMLLCYGKRLTDQWGMTDSGELIAAWTEGLEGLSRVELIRGREALRTRTWPPTLPEFIALCRPNLDPVVAHHEACQQGQRRERGEDEQWSHPAIYWAWVSVGAHALTHLPYEQIRSRWCEALLRYANDPALPPVPSRAIALPAPGAARAQPERARSMLAQLKVRSAEACPAGSDKRWAVTLLDKAKRGERVTATMYEMAERALGLR